MYKVILTLISLVSTIVVFELFLRFSPFSHGISPVEYDKDIGMWHKKNFSSNKIAKCYNTRYFFDEKGLIQNNYEQNRSKKDILIFGDSYIEALMVKNSHVIHNSLYKAFKGKYNFINYGLAGISPLQEFIMMKTKADFSHAYMVIQFIRIESDIYDVDSTNLDNTARPQVFLAFTDLGHYRVIPPKTKDLKETVRDILGNFELYVYLRKGIYFIKHSLTTKTDNKITNQKEKNLDYNWLQIKGVLYQTKKLLLAKGVRYKIFLYGKDANKTKYFKSILDNLKIEYHDIYALAKREGFELEGFSCDSHWKDKTHQKVADLIQEENLLK